MKVVSIDIGVQHFAMLELTADSKTGLLTAQSAQLIDLTIIQHTHVHRENCLLPHGNQFAHRIAHLIQEYPCISECDVLLVESQPVMSGHGLSIQNLLLQQFHKKITLVSPNAVHSYYNISGLDYEGRKKWSIAHLYKNCLSAAVLKSVDALDRKHDIADAFLIATWWWEHKRSSYRIQERSVKALGDVTVLDYLNRFKFEPNKA